MKIEDAGMTVEGMMQAIHQALSDAVGCSAHLGRLQACEVTDDEGEPTGRGQTLIDGYFDMRKVAEAVMVTINDTLNSSPK